MLRGELLDTRLGNSQRALTAVYPFMVRSPAALKRPVEKVPVTFLTVRLESLTYQLTVRLESLTDKRFVQ